ncbi:unnamed protein product [Phyllotreta striolata]|uniref:Kinesin-like protein n=1 Tax=Phyllotreta striolata TaxID=444603 RepID=A0A9N9XKN6_PHYSR|nr:unnamed protein product [Phyllotreta striolata]
MDPKKRTKLPVAAAQSSKLRVKTETQPSSVSVSATKESKKPFLRKRSMSMTEFSVSSKSKTAFKRPAPVPMNKIVTSQKPKKPKIPDWDYKSRFQNLQGIHTKLVEDSKKSQERLNDLENIEEQYLKLKGDFQTVETERNAFKVQLNETSSKLERLENIESKYQSVTKELVHITDENRTLKIKNDELNSTLQQLYLERDTLKKSNEQLGSLLEKNEVVRRKLHNNVQDLKGNIRVFCRIRPAINEQENVKEKCYLKLQEDSSLEIAKSNAVNNKQVFTFNTVFHEGSTQLECFEELAQLVQSALDGYHVCVFAYGQTGSGKTYTMQGLDTPNDIGMIPRTVNLIFDSIENLKCSNWTYEVRVSFLEIYNETVRDLLTTTLQNLDICFNEGKGTTVNNLQIKQIFSYDDFEHYLKIAQKNRMVAATDFNEHSSRSHAITKIYLIGKNQSGEYYAGSINLVDLAGSESAKTSHGERLVETKAINKSLSNLGKVMLSLCNKEKHIPYRNSKLTYLLQSCLGGNSKTLMIVNISPFEENYGESINSLRFASMVKEVKTKSKKVRALAPIECNN